MKRLILIIPVLVISIAVIAGISTVHAQERSQADDEQRNEAVIAQRRAWNREESEKLNAQADLKELGVPQVPEYIAELCESAGKQYNICPELLEAIAWKESSLNPDAANGSCKGLMQVNTAVHQDKLDVYGGDWSDPHTNIYAAAMLINQLVGQGYEELGSIMSEYHGEGTPDAYSEYTQEVRRISADLERIDGK